MEIDKTIGGIWDDNLTRLDDIAYYLYIKYRKEKNVVVSHSAQLLFCSLKSFMYNRYYDDALLIMRNEKILKLKTKIYE